MYFMNAGNGDGGQDADDGDHDHELDEREALGLRLAQVRHV
jgi:hypothetical protein